MILRAKLLDATQIHHLTKQIDLKPSIFIKNSLKEIKNILSYGQSFVYVEEDKVKAFLLVKKNYIDTIVSTKKGIGSKLLDALPVGKYKVNISSKNSISIKLFTSKGFVLKGVEYLGKYPRMYYENKI